MYVKIITIHHLVHDSLLNTVKNLNRINLRNLRITNILFKFKTYVLVLGFSEKFP